MSKGPQHVHVTYIKTTPERLWQALTEGAMTKQYYFSGTVKSDWKNGSTYRFTGPKGELQIEGKVVEADPPRKLVTTFSAVWDDDVKKDKPSMATFEIEPMGEACKLTVIHEGFEGETATYHQVSGGWPFIVASLKSLLETGEALKAVQPQQEKMSV
jgi:uncharacterized protein YndB with AHSA1/START domain